MSRGVNEPLTLGAAVARKSAIRERKGGGKTASTRPRRAAWRGIALAKPPGGAYVRACFASWAAREPSALALKLPFVRLLSCARKSRRIEFAAKSEKRRAGPVRRSRALRSKAPSRRPSKGGEGFCPPRFQGRNAGVAEKKSVSPRFPARGRTTASGAPVVLQAPARAPGLRRRLAPELTFLAAIFPPSSTTSARRARTSNAHFSVRGRPSAPQESYTCPTR